MTRRVLVIDDDEGIRRSFELSLRPTGYHVDTADGGEAGLRLIEQNHYDLVYLDLKMPGMDGAETLRRIRERDTELPVYIVTAFHREFFADLAEARKLALPFDVIRKPLDRDQVIAITRGILEGVDDLGGDDD